jgi:hypothetical protein
MSNGETVVRKAVQLLAVAVLSVALLPVAAYSQEDDGGLTREKLSEMTPEERREAWENLSDEDKQAMREQMRARREQRRAEWEAMTPEEREAKREEMRKRMESMTPEQREAMRNRMERRRHHGGRKGGEKREGA